MAIRALFRPVAFILLFIDVCLRFFFSHPSCSAPVKRGGIWISYRNYNTNKSVARGKIKKKKKKMVSSAITFPYLTITAMEGKMQKIP
jgi:hypothetical protein